MNKNTLNIHLEILDKDRQELLNKLLPFVNGFALSGGTALALQIAHRKSFDFDFFSTSPIKRSLAEKISQAISITNISVDTSDELTLFTKEKIKLTFLHYPFKHIYPLNTLANGLQLFSVPDIAIQKAYTIGRRGEYRDYFDLYTILKNQYTSFDEVVSGAKRIFGSVFEEKIFLQQLVYFGDFLSYDIIPAREPAPTPENVKGFFEDLVEKYL